MLNSKGEYNRSKITRLTLGEAQEGRKKVELKEDTMEDEVDDDPEAGGRKTYDAEGRRPPRKTNKEV